MAHSAENHLTVFEIFEKQFLIDVSKCADVSFTHFDFTDMKFTHKPESSGIENISLTKNMHVVIKYEMYYVTCIEHVVYCMTFVFNSGQVCGRICCCMLQHALTFIRKKYGRNLTKSGKSQ